QRTLSERHEGAGGERDQAGVVEPALRRDGDDGRRVNQEHEVVERVRDVDKDHRAPRQRFAAHSMLRDWLATIVRRKRRPQGHRVARRLPQPAGTQSHDAARRSPRRDGERLNFRSAKGLENREPRSNMPVEPRVATNLEALRPSKGEYTMILL